MQPERETEGGETTGHRFTRRRVLIGAVAAGISATLPDLAWASARLRTTGFTRARFAPHVGTTVTLRPARAPEVRAKLVGVEDLPGESVRHLAGSQDAYALRFRAPASLRIPHGTVAIRHPRFGVLRLFVTRSSGTARHQDYIAVINRVLR